MGLSDCICIIGLVACVDDGERLAAGVILKERG